MNETGTIARVREKLNWLFSQRWMGAAVVLTAILARIIQQVYFFNTRSDMSYQMLGMQHLLEGNGISLASVDPSDISSVIYEPLNKWPPGFSLLLVPFYLLCGKNYIAAALLPGIACSILLIFVTRGILKLCGVAYYLVNIFTLVTGIFSYYFYTFPCTDAIGISFLITGFYFGLRILKNKGSLKSNLLLLCLSLITSGFIKYLFIPAVFVIPAFLLLKGTVNKSSRLKKAGIYSLVVLITVFGSFLLSQKTGSGTIGYIKETQRGFYPENLKAAFPFVTGSFIRPDTAERVLPQGSSAGEFVYTAFQFITVISFLFIAFILAKQFIRNRLKDAQGNNDFAWLSFLISAAIILLLFFLSLRVGKESFDFGKWTYVQEARYYGAVVVFIHMAVFIFYQQCKTFSPEKRNLFSVLLLLLMLPEMARGISFSANRILKMGKETYGWQQELRFQKAADGMIRKIKTEHPEKSLVLAGSSDWMLLRVSLYSHVPAITDANVLLNAPEIKSAGPSILFAVIAEDKKDVYKSFLSLTNVKQESAAGGFLFYSLPVYP